MYHIKYAAILALIAISVGLAIVGCGYSSENGPPNSDPPTLETNSEDNLAPDIGEFEIFPKTQFEIDEQRWEVVVEVIPSENWEELAWASENYLDVTIKDSEKNEVEGSARVEYSFGYMTGTDKRQIKAVDVDNDGYDDILIELGTIGKEMDYLCFLYDEQSKGFVYLENFQYIPNPQPVEGENLIVGQLQAGTTYGELNYAVKYVVEGFQLVLTGRLTQEVDVIKKEILYTEEALIYGEMAVVKSSVPREEIENFDTWLMSEPYING